MNANEIRKKSISELYKDIIVYNKELSLLTMQIKSGKSTDVAKKKSLKKDIARIKTVISEKQVLESNEKA